QGEGRSEPQAVAVCFDLPAMHLEQALAHRKTDSKPAGVAAEGPGTLRKQVEDMWQKVGGDPFARVADLHDSAAIAFEGCNADCRAFRRILCRIVEHIRKAL